MQQDSQEWTLICSAQAWPVAEDIVPAWVWIYPKMKFIVIDCVYKEVFKH